MKKLKSKRNLKSIISFLRQLAKERQLTVKAISFAVILQAIKILTKPLYGLPKSRLTNTRGKL